MLMKSFLSVAPSILIHFFIIDSIQLKVTHPMIYQWTFIIRSYQILSDLISISWMFLGGSQAHFSIFESLDFTRLSEASSAPWQATTWSLLAPLNPGRTSRTSSNATKLSTWASLILEDDAIFECFGCQPHLFHVVHSDSCLMGKLAGRFWMFLKRCSSETGLSSPQIDFLVAEPHPGVCENGRRPLIGYL